VLDVELVCLLGRDMVRKILSTLLTFNGKDRSDNANCVISGVESSIVKLCCRTRLSGLVVIGNDDWFVFE
jgi:hypothetical protein